jgi:hypothetical protein
MQSAKCKGQNNGNNTVVKGYPSILQFEIYNLHFALMAAIGRAIQGGHDES